MAIELLLRRRRLISRMKPISIRKVHWLYLLLVWMDSSDSEEVVTPLMLDGTYLSRNFATLGPLT